MYDHILLPIALDHNPQKGPAMQIAQTLLSETGKITVLSVVEMAPSYVDAHVPVEMKAQQVEETKNLVQEFAAIYPKCEAHVVYGHAANSILSFAGEHDVDCIIIASHKPGLADYLIGSTANRVVRHAQCNVHVVR